MKRLIVITAVIFAFGSAIKAQQSQNSTERTISISMTASELLPADLITFNVTINAEANTPQDGFAIHQERESVLARLLKKHDIKESDIHFQPVSMRKRYNNDRDNYRTTTSQQVSVSFSDFSNFEVIQMSLIEHGFDQFNGSFSSTKMSEGKDAALVTAIEAARQKAELIAKTSGDSLGKVKSITYGDYVVSSRMMNMEFDGMMEMKRSSMMEFDQSVKVSANISMVFFLKN